MIRHTIMCHIKQFHKAKNPIIQTLAVFPNKDEDWVPVPVPKPPNPDWVVVVVPNNGRVWLKGVAAAEFVLPNPGNQNSTKEN